jgi:hypothetical protein
MWIYLGVSENEVYPQLAICEWENAVRGSNFQTNLLRDAFFDQE